MIIINRKYALIAVLGLTLSNSIFGQLKSGVITYERKVNLLKNLKTADLKNGLEMKRLN